MMVHFRKAEFRWSCPFHIDLFEELMNGHGKQRVRVKRCHDFFSLLDTHHFAKIIPILWPEGQTRT
jgi:hypothetical protein